MYLPLRNNLVYAVPFVTFCCLASCKSKTPEAIARSGTVVADTFERDTLSEEQKVYDKVEKLPEVKRAEFYIDSFSNHKHGIAFMTANEPAKDHYYVVRAGYNGDFRFETYFLFYVYVPSLEVKYYRAVDDTVISLDTWRNDKKRFLPY